MDLVDLQLNERAMEVANELIEQADDVNVVVHNVGDAVFAVRDWLHFRIPIIERDWPIFNIADSLLVCGAGLMMWHAWRGEKAGAATVAPQAEAEKLQQAASGKQTFSGKA